MRSRAVYEAITHTLTYTHTHTHTHTQTRAREKDQVEGPMVSEARHSAWLEPHFHALHFPLWKQENLTSTHSLTP